MNIAKNADSTKILTVVNRESDYPNQYAAKCTDNISMQLNVQTTWKTM